MKQKLSKHRTKRVFITALAALCAMSSMAAITASAKTEKYVHTVAIATGKGENDCTWMTMKKAGVCSDIFDNYPTIFDKYKKSVSKVRIENSKCKGVTSYKTVVLQKNSSSPVTVNYGAINNGQYLLRYRYDSYGGFKDKVTTCKKY